MRIAWTRKRAIAAAFCAAALAGCTASPPPAVAPAPQTVATAAAPSAPPARYVPVLPLPPDATPESALIRDGRPVGEADAATPDDAQVRVLHGNYSQARTLFQQLVAGGRLVQQSTNGPVTTIRYRLPEGAELTYVLISTRHGSMTSADAEIIVNDPSVPITRLRFRVPGGTAMPLVARDGGGGM